MVEYQYEKTVVQKAEAAGWYVKKYAFVGVRGGPDRMFIKDGRVVFIEFKDQGKTAEALQAKCHREMREAGAEVHCLDNPWAALRVLGLSVK